MSGFRITAGKGFHVEFENGWTVSVQFGPGNYCSNYDMSIGYQEAAAGKAGSHDAEVAAWPASGDMHEWESGDAVLGRQSPADVLKILNWAAIQPAQEQAA